MSCDSEALESPVEGTGRHRRASSAWIRRDRVCDARAVLGHVEPARCARRMRERDRDRSVELVADADALADAAHAEQPARREAADGDDETGLQQAELFVPPALAEPLLLRRRRSVAAPGGGPARIAARDRRAVERRVELVLVQLEPAAQRLARPAAPRPALLSLDDPRAPARRGTRAAPSRGRSPEATRAGSRPRRRRGTPTDRASGPRASGSSRRRANDDEPAARVEHLAVELSRPAPPGRRPA